MGKRSKSRARVNTDKNSKNTNEDNNRISDDQSQSTSSLEEQVEMPPIPSITINGTEVETYQDHNEDDEFYDIPPNEETGDDGNGNDGSLDNSAFQLEDDEDDEDDNDTKLEQETKVDQIGSHQSNQSDSKPSELKDNGLEKFEKETTKQEIGQNQVEESKSEAEPVKQIKESAEPIKIEEIESAKQTESTDQSESGTELIDEHADQKQVKKSESEVELTKQKWENEKVETQNLNDSVLEQETGQAMPNSKSENEKVEQSKLKDSVLEQDPEQTNSESTFEAINQESEKMQIKKADESEAEQAEPTDLESEKEQIEKVNNSEVEKTTQLSLEETLLDHSGSESERNQLNTELESKIFEQESKQEVKLGLEGATKQLESNEPMLMQVQTTEGLELSQPPAPESGLNERQGQLEEYVFSMENDDGDDIIPFPNYKPNRDIIPIITESAETKTKLTSYSTISDSTSEVINNSITDLIFGVCIVGFHHAEGPQVEYWIGPDGDKSDIWPFLPFQSLPDGSHAQEESFSYFTLLYDETQKLAPTSSVGFDPADPHSDVVTLFGMACNRQMKSSELKQRTSDVTRSTVQKSVVVISRKPIFGVIKEKLMVVTRAYFMQGDFNDRDIIKSLYENLAITLKPSTNTKIPKIENRLLSSSLNESDLYIGLSLRDLIYRFQVKALVLFKALLLEKRILFYGTNTEVLCTTQMSLISLIPNLVKNLGDCASPLLNKSESRLYRPTSVKTSDRSSLLQFMGLPLQIFSQGGIFSPYVSLQQSEDLSNSQYYVIGTTNSLFMAQKKQLSDIFVNLNTNRIEIFDSSLATALTLTTADKQWMERIKQSVVSTWNENDPTRDLVYYGSDDYIRGQFEDYLLGLLASVKYDSFLSKHGNPPPVGLTLKEINGNPIHTFGNSWVAYWKQSHNYRLFDTYTDTELFDIVEPRHVSEISNIKSAKTVNTSLVIGDIRNVHEVQDKNEVVSLPSLSSTAASSPSKEIFADKVSKVFGGFWSGGNNGSSPSPVGSNGDLTASPEVVAIVPVQGDSASNSSPELAPLSPVGVPVDELTSDTVSYNSQEGINDTSTDINKNNNIFSGGWSKWRKSLFGKNQQVETAEVDTTKENKPLPVTPVGVTVMNSHDDDRV